MDFSNDTYSGLSCNNFRESCMDPSQDIYWNSISGFFIEYVQVLFPQEFLEKSIPPEILPRFLQIVLRFFQGLLQVFVKYFCRTFLEIKLGISPEIFREILRGISSLIPGFFLDFFQDSTPFRESSWFLFGIYLKIQIGILGNSFKDLSCGFSQLSIIDFCMDYLRTFS